MDKIIISNGVSFASMDTDLVIKLCSIAVVPVIYSVVLGNDNFFKRMRIQSELFKMLFLTFYVYQLFALLTR